MVRQVSSRQRAQIRSVGAVPRKMTRKHRQPHHLRSEVRVINRQRQQAHSESPLRDFVRCSATRAEAGCQQLRYHAARSRDGIARGGRAAHGKDREGAQLLCDSLLVRDLLVDLNRAA